MARNTVRFWRAKPMLRQVSVRGLGLMRSFGAGGGRGRDGAAGQPAERCDDEAGSGHPDRIDPGPGEQSTGQRANQDRNEGAGLDQRIAADQLLLLQVLRQDRVLDRSEQRRMQAEQEQCRHQHGEAVQREAGGSDNHDAHFKHLDHARQHRLVVLVRQLAGRRREEEKGQDEDAGRKVRQYLRLHRRPLRRLKGEQDDQRVLEQVVVEGTEELREEEWPEALRLQQAELVAHGCGSPYVVCCCQGLQQ